MFKWLSHSLTMNKLNFFYILFLNNLNHSESIEKTLCGHEYIFFASDTNQPNILSYSLAILQIWR